MEEFRVIKGHENYEINEYGVVRRVDTHRIMCDHVRGINARPTVELSSNGVIKKLLVSRLVAIAFIPNDDPSKFEVDHIDRNFFNSHVSNLKWVTKSENCQNRDNVALSHNFDGKRKEIPVVRIDLKTGEEIFFKSMRLAAESLNPVDWRDLENKRKNIGQCCRGKQKTAFGYGFKFADTNLI